MLRVWVEEIKRKIEIYNYESVSLAKDEKWCDEGWKSRNYRDRKYLNKKKKKRLVRKKSKNNKKIKCWT